MEPSFNADYPWTPKKHPTHLRGEFYSLDIPLCPPLDESGEISQDFIETVHMEIQELCIGLTLDSALLRLHGRSLGVQDVRHFCADQIVAYLKCSAPHQVCLSKTDEPLLIHTTEPIEERCNRETTKVPKTWRDHLLKELHAMLAPAVSRFFVRIPWLTPRYEEIDTWVRHSYYAHNYYEYWNVAVAPPNSHSLRMQQYSNQMRERSWEELEQHRAQRNHRPEGGNYRFY